MSQKSISVVRIVLRTLLSISIIIAGICLIVGCVSIYTSDAYSRENAIAALSDISLPIYACVVLVVIGFVFELITDSKISDAPNRKDNKSILTRLVAKKDLTKCDATLASGIKKQRIARKTRAVINAVLTVAATVIFLSYALNKNSFSADINESIINAMKALLPCLLLPFAYAVYSSYLNDASRRTEIDLLKQAPNAENATESPKRERLVFADVAKVLILFAGIGILLYGYLSGGIEDVLTKAVNICTECIGLG